MRMSRRNNSLLVVTACLCSSVVVVERAAVLVSACEDRGCPREAREALCAYTKCVLQLDKKSDRTDAAERRKQCRLGLGAIRGPDAPKDDDGSDFVFGEAGCLPALTNDVADDFAGTCVEGDLRIADACEWGRMYVNLSCQAEARPPRVVPATVAEPFDRKTCDTPCPAEECIGIGVCVTTGNRNKCLKLQDDGCNAIASLESCPYQYKCADP